MLIISWVSVPLGRNCKLYLSTHGCLHGTVQYIVKVQIIHSCTYYRKAIPTGMLSGGMGQFLASPTDLVKTRLQMEGRRLLDGYKPRLVSIAVSFALCRSSQ